MADVGDWEMGLKARLEDLVMIDRGGHAGVSGVRLETATQDLASNTDDAYGFPPYASLAPYLKIGGIRCDELAQREQRILAGALGGVLTQRIVVRDYSWATVIEQHIGLGTPPAQEPQLEPVLDPVVAT